MDFKTRRALFNACNPKEALEPLDPRNVELDRLTKGGHLVRGADWVDRLASRIELSDRPSLELFTGLPGSGKSTVLRRLSARLEDEQRAHLMVVYLDAEHTFDLTNPIDLPDILAALVHAAERRVLQAQGKDPRDALKDGYLTRLWSWLSNTDVELKSANLKVAAGANLVTELRTRPTLRQRVRATVAAHLSRFLDEVHNELSRLQEQARGLGYQGMVVVLDSLEKLQGISTNYDEVIASAEKLFAGGARYLQLPVHALYTVPAALLARRFNLANFLPMIKLTTKAGDDFTDGLQVARYLIDKRVPSEQLAAHLGPHSEARIEQLIRWSGGYPREMVRLLQAMFTIEQSPIPDDAFQRLLNEVQDSYRKVIHNEDLDWLARVALDKYVHTEDPEQQSSTADRMLYNNAVLRYLNNSDWFDLHPAVRGLPEVQQAILRLKQQRLDAGHGDAGQGSGTGGHGSSPDGHGIGVAGHEGDTGGEQPPAAR